MLKYKYLFLKKANEKAKNGIRVGIILKIKSPSSKNNGKSVYFSLFYQFNFFEV